MFHLSFRLALLFVLTTLLSPSFAQVAENAGFSTTAPFVNAGFTPLSLVIVECIYIGLILAGGFFVAYRSRGKSAPLRGLNLPNGSVRSMLALMIVGTFVIFLVLGGDVEQFDNVVSAFGTLTGAVIGFYFAHRGAETETPGAETDTPSAETDTPSAETDTPSAETDTSGAKTDTSAPFDNKQDMP